MTQKSQLKISYLSPDRIRPYKNNPKVHKDKQGANKFKHQRVYVYESNIIG